MDAEIELLALRVIEQESERLSVGELLDVGNDDRLSEMLALAE